MPTPTKWGDEFLVNTTTEEHQRGPTITGLADGRFVVAWTDTSETGDDKSRDAVRAQVFNADGSKSGKELLVNTATEGSQFTPTITALADGGFVVAWIGKSETVRGQVFDADGDRAGNEFLVDATAHGQQYEPTITALVDGGFVVAWIDQGENGGDPSGGAVRAQVFNGDGSKFGGELLVNTTTVDDQDQPTIAGLADGGFVVAWTDHSETGGDASALDVRAQVFNPNGSKSGGEFLVNTTTEDWQYRPTITGLADGGFVVAWNDERDTGNFTSSLAVRGQVFDADGSKSGAEFLVNTSAGDQWQPTITALADGRFVVAWDDLSQPGGDVIPKTVVRAQVLNADGTRSGGEFLVNTTTDKAQTDPTITALADGRFVVAWTDYSQSGGDESRTAVRAQIFDPREEAIDLDGGDLDDQFVGTAFDDTIGGAGGKDRLFGDKGNDSLAGGEKKDILKGNEGRDSLEGDDGKDLLKGGDGKDELHGGEGKDKLDGGKGKDQFIFAEMGKDNADRIKDFDAGKDAIVLDGDVFSGIGDHLGKKEFEIGKKADDGNDHVIYHKGKGKLYWDGDGKGGEDQVLFAKLDDGLKLGHDDFLIL